jgi:DNA topoisomerase IB
MYYIIEKDVESKIGFIYSGGYETIKEAEKYIKVLRKTLTPDYYDIFVAETESGL